MSKEWYINELNNCKDYERVYGLVSDASDDAQVSDSDWNEIYEVAKDTLC